MGKSKNILSLKKESLKRKESRQIHRIGTKIKDTAKNLSTNAVFFQKQ